MKWYRKAAARDDAEAENNIGLLYQQGLGLNPDNAEATNWFRKAAAKGNTNAITNLLYGQEQIPGAGVTQAPANLTMPICNDNTAQSCITPPQAIFDPDPEYTKEAREAKYQGTCIIGLIVEADGSPSHVTLIRGLGKGLDEKALDAIRSWKFKPATKGGTPVPTQIAIQVVFHLY